MKIAVFSDLHYSDRINKELPCRRGDLALKLLDSVIEFLNREYHPELAVCTGDLLNEPDRADLLSEIARHLARLNVPQIIIPGNHDPAAEIFYRSIPKPPEYLDLDGIRFIPFPDDPERPGYNAARTDSETARMIQIASAFDGLSVSIQHVPLFRPGIGKSRYNYESADSLLDMLESTGIRLTISGHEHAGMMPVSDGKITTLAAPALCEMPFSFLVFELDKQNCIPQNFKILTATR